MATGADPNICGDMLAYAPPICSQKPTSAPEYSKRSDATEEIRRGLKHLIKKLTEFGLSSQDCRFEAVIAGSADLHDLLRRQLFYERRV